MCHTRHMRSRRHFSLPLTIALSAMVLGSVVGAPAAESVPGKTECATDDPTWVKDGIRAMQKLGGLDAPGVIGELFFGLEVAPEITEPITLNRGGYQRLWDMGVDWADVNPSAGVFDWSVLDMRVKQVTDAGARPLYVLGLTPEWAATNPEAGDERWGKGTASAPKNLEDWRAYVKAVAERYNGNNGVGKIWAFETWNEANITTFWDNGEADSADPFGMGTLASMTKIANDTINTVNPDALLIAATTTTRVRGANDNFGGPQKRYRAYLEALKAQNWPFDAWGIHSYPAGNAGPGSRMADVQCWQEIVIRNMGEASVKSQLANPGGEKPLYRPIFDTEVNFGFAGPGDVLGALYDANLSEALIWRAYIDSARLGIDSTTWYLHSLGEYKIDGNPMGVQMYESQTSIAAYRSARSQLPYLSPFAGCTNIGAAGSPRVNSCEFRSYERTFFNFDGNSIGSAFLVFAEDVFSGPTPTIPFNAYLYPLVPDRLATPVMKREKVEALSGLPAIVAAVKGVD